MLTTYFFNRMYTVYSFNTNKHFIHDKGFPEHYGQSKETAQQ